MKENKANANLSTTAKANNCKTISSNSKEQQQSQKNESVDKKNIPGTNKENINEGEKLCICQKTYEEDSSDMLDCQVCEKWFHSNCIPYTCGECEQKDAKHNEYLEQALEVERQKTYDVEEK